MDWVSMVAVGRIIRPHGNRGHVVVESATDFGPERFRGGARVYVRRGDAVEPLVVTAGRERGGRWIVGFEGIESIDDAEAWRGQELKVPADALHALAPDAFYVHDLIGCEVVTVAGSRVGTVGRVDLATGVPMLIVGTENEVLVPFIDAICRAVDVQHKRISIDPPAGLVDLNVKKRPADEPR